MTEQADSGNSLTLDGEEPELNGGDLDNLVSVNFATILETLGPSRKYQLCQAGMLIFFLVPYEYTLMNFVFLGYEPPHVCAETNETDLLSQYSIVNDTTAKVVYETCRIRITSNKTGHTENLVSIGCVNGHSYEGGKFVSMKTEWDLVCERQGVAELVQTMFNVGLALGSVLITHFSDKFGRKYVIVGCSISGCLLELIMTFSPSIEMVIALRFLSGTVFQCLVFVPYVLGAEVLVTKQRQVYAMLTIMMWAVFMMTFGSVCYALRFHSWRRIQLFSSLVGIIPMFFLFFINESLPWLIAKGRHSKALEILRKASRINGANFSDVKQAYDQCVQRLKRLEEKYNKDETKSTVDRYTVLDIFRSTKLLRTTMIMCLAFFSINMAYNGLYFMSATLDVNRFFVFLILSATEIPSTLLFYGLLLLIGRRTIIIVFISLAAVCLLVSTCISSKGSLSSKHITNSSTAFFIFGKFTINVGLTCLYTFAGDHYPTTLRTVGFGMGLFMARVGGMVSPFLYPLFGVASWAPGTILTILCLITVSLYPLVPETSGRELPTTIEEAEVSHTRFKPQAFKRKNQVSL